MVMAFIMVIMAAGRTTLERKIDEQGEQGQTEKGFVISFYQKSPVFFLGGGGNRCHKPLSNLEVSRATPNNESFM